MKLKRVHQLVNTIVILGLMAFGMVAIKGISLPSDQLHATTPQVITENTTWANGTFYVNESVMFSADLSISNATVIFKANATNNVILEVGGILSINNSVIRAENNDYNGELKSLTGTSITIENSHFIHINLNINGVETNLRHNVIDNCQMVNFISLPSTSVVAGNDFKNNETGMLLSYSPITVANNTFEHLTNGIVATSSNNLVISGNTFNGVQNAISGKSSSGKIENNTITNADVAIGFEYSSKLQITGNTINNVNTSISFSSSSHSTIEKNVITDVKVGAHFVLSSYIELVDNSISNIDNIIVKSEQSNYMTYQENTFNNSLRGVTLSDNSQSLLQQNEFYNVSLGINVEYSEFIDLVGNEIYETITGIYLEDDNDIIMTANNVNLASTVGISIWSSERIDLSSNTIVNSSLGIGLHSVEDAYLLGNALINTTTGLYGEDLTNGEIIDGSYSAVESAVVVLNSPELEIRGNTFSLVTGDAITLTNSNASVVYWNNFYTISGKYGEIEDCIVFYDYAINNETKVGNYYANNPAANTVVIDETTYNGKVYTIEDEHPLSEPYTVPPAVSVVSRDVIKPDDTMIVNVTAHIYIPSELSVSVILQYLTTTHNEWINRTMVKQYSLGQINIYTGSIPTIDYGEEVTYRVLIVYGGNYCVPSDNSTYIVDSSDKTPLIIDHPSVYVRAEGSDDFTMTSTYYTQYYIIVQVRVVNQTADMQEIAGKRYVNISWTIWAVDGTNKTLDSTMDYNATTNMYYLELGQFEAGTNITYRIYAEDAVGHTRWTLETYRIEITSEEVSSTGFDSLTLISITASLFIIQTIVVMKRRRRKED